MGITMADDTENGCGERISELIAISACLSYGMQIINLLLSAKFSIDNFTGFVEFVPAAILGHIHYSDYSIHQYLSTIALLIWSSRLTGFLIYRMQARSAMDSRLYHPEHRTIPQLLGFWLLHGSWGVVVSLPVTLLNACADQSYLTMIDY